MLRPGLTCDLRVRNNELPHNTVLFPYRAVVEQMGEYYVFVRERGQGTQNGGSAWAARMNDMVVVKEGLNPATRSWSTGCRN